MRLLKFSDFLLLENDEIDFDKYYNKGEEKILIWIHGLPGSGKTHLANRIMKSNPDANFVHFDDTGSVRDIRIEMEMNRNIIVSSPFFEGYMRLSSFCLNKSLKELIKDKNYTCRDIWFENNLKKCIANVSRRIGHQMPKEDLLSVLPHFSNLYEIPDNADIIPIFSTKND
jgi:gluconate kinase